MIFLTETKCKVRRLMEKNILNFHFDYLNPSLRKLLLAKCDSQEKQFASSMNPFISEHVFDTCERVNGGGNELF